MDIFAAPSKDFLGFADLMHNCQALVQPEFGIRDNSITKWKYIRLKSNANKTSCWAAAQ